MAKTCGYIMNVPVKRTKSDVLSVEMKKIEKISKNK